MSYTITSALQAYKTIKTNNDFADDTTHSRALSHARTAQDLLDQATPEEIREYLDITRSILNDLESRMVEPDAFPSLDQLIEEMEASLVEETPAVATKTKGASRVKRSKKVDAIVENVKGKRDINAGDKARIDEAKAQDVKPAKVQQEKRTTKKAAPAAKAKTEKRTHEGMSYSEVRKEVSARKAKLNKADQERMAKAGCKNNTWDSAIESLTWLNRYFPTK